jgi:type IV pilus assembly protein PilA
MSARSNQSGFSVVELALVVAATLIVLALGVSMYRTYSARLEIVTSIEETAPARTLVVAAYEAHGTPPADLHATGIDRSAALLLGGTYFDALTIHNGRIDLRFSDAASSGIAGKTLSLTPFETAGRDVLWVCGNETPGVGLNPLGFAGGGPQPIRVPTSIEDRYLPRECR